MKTGPGRAWARRGSRVEVLNGRPTIVLDGTTVPQSACRDYILWDGWQDRVREFAESGVTVFDIRVPQGRQGKGEDFFDVSLWHSPDDSAYVRPLDRQAEFILSVCPKAVFRIVFDLSPPLAWTRRHPGEMQTDETGRRFRWPSLASALYRRDLVAYLRRVVRFCEGKPWADRIAAYMALPYGEGLTPLTLSGKMFDCSPASGKAFRAWLRKRYGTDARLRKAWGDPSASLARARVPRDADWLRKRREGVPTVKGSPVDLRGAPTNSGEAVPGLFHWIEAANAAPELDYGRFMRDLCFRWIRTVLGSVKGAARALGRDRVVTVDALKQPLLGWAILSSFDGIGDAAGVPNPFLFSGSWDVAGLLDDPALDGTWTPADYTARTVGCALESEGLTDSLVLRGKLAILENDARTYVGAGIREQGAFRTPAEVEAGLRRNTAMALSRGLHDYWCNVGSSYFHDAAIQRTIRRVAAMTVRARRQPRRETRDAIAFVIDDTSVAHEDFTAGFQSLAVIWQRVRGLARCGVPYRIFLLSDLERRRPPACKVWLFPNLFQVDGARLALLRRTVLRDGNLALFGPATGITDGRHLGAEGASAVLGVPMELVPRTTVRHVIVQDYGHPITRELPANMLYGDTLAYGPTLVPADGALEAAKAVPLGHANTCWFINRPGLFLRESGRGAAGNGRRGRRGAGDCGVVWSVAMPLPPGLLRACARYAGCHVWCEEDDVVYASDSLAALHSMKAGSRTLRLPRPARVTDAVTGRPVGRGAIDRIRLTVKPPQTRVFLLADGAETAEGGSR